MTGDDPTVFGREISVSGRSCHADHVVVGFTVRTPKLRLARGKQVFQGTR